MPRVRLGDRAAIPRFVSRLRHDPLRPPRRAPPNTHVSGAQTGTLSSATAARDAFCASSLLPRAEEGVAAAEESSLWVADGAAGYGPALSVAPRACGGRPL